MIEPLLPRGQARPELAPALLSVVEQARAQRYQGTYLMIQKGFTLREASHLLHWRRWAFERIGVDR